MLVDHLYVAWGRLGEVGYGEGSEADVVEALEDLVVGEEDVLVLFGVDGRFGLAGRAGAAHGAVVAGALVAAEGETFATAVGHCGGGCGVYSWNLGIGRFGLVCFVWVGGDVGNN